MTIARPPIVFKTWRPNAASAGVNDQPLGRPEVVALLLGKDTFFGGSGRGPVYDWPNPNLLRNAAGASIRAQADERQQPLVLNLLKGKDTFFRTSGYAPTYDWPNPRGRDWGAANRAWNESWENRLNNLLVGKDRIYRGPGQVVTYDWPNPTLRKDPAGVAIRAEDDVWVDTNPTLLRNADQFFGLGGVPQFDWPNPRGYVPAIVLRTWTDPYKLNLVGQDRIYRGPGEVPTYDYPNPRGYVPGSISLRTWTDQYRLQLNPGTDTFFGLAGHPTFDWPNPILRRDASGTAIRAEGEVWRNWSTLYPPPFFETDWPNPRGYIPSIALRTWTDPLKLNLLGKDRFFGLGGAPNFDWPNPVRSRDRSPPDQAQQLGSLLYVVASPFNQFNWQNPVMEPTTIVGYVSGPGLPIIAPPAPGSEPHNLKFHADTGAMMSR